MFNKILQIFNCYSSGSVRVASPNTHCYPRCYHHCHHHCYHHCYHHCCHHGYHRFCHHFSVKSCSTISGVSLLRILDIIFPLCIQVIPVRSSDWLVREQLVHVLEATGDESFDEVYIDILAAPRVSAMFDWIF